MLLPDPGEPVDGVVPGLVGPVNQSLPSMRDSEPPMPVRTQKYAPPAPTGLLRADDPEVLWMRLALFLAWFVFVLAWEPGTAVAALLYLAVWAIPRTVLKQLIPKRLKQPTLVQADSGDTWITHVPSVRVEGDPGTIRLPFRVLSALLALVLMLPAMMPFDELQLFERIFFFLGGMMFGAIALVPAGDVRRMVPRISPAPRLSAAGDDAGAAGAVGQIS